MNRAVVACCAFAACTVFADVEMINIAHRGMWDKAVPQNTVEAIRRAYESGATWVETDFHYTKSGLMVCMHGQKELEEQTGCTKKIADLTAEDLATLNLGAKRNLTRVYRIPLLDQVLALVPKHGVLQAEIKGYSPQYADVFDRAVKAHGLTEKNIVVSSFQYKALKDFKARYPKYRAVWLTGLGKKGEAPFSVQAYIAKCKAANIEVFCPGCDSTKGVMTPADADAVRAAGLEFRVFGVNSLADLKQAKALGAAGFTCNHWFKAYEWANELGGVALLPARDPRLPRDAIVLFDGTQKSLDANWMEMKGGKAKWKCVDGTFEATRSTGDIRTRREFGDVQLHIEWQVPANLPPYDMNSGNSGVFMMGLYEVQVFESFETDPANMKHPFYADGQAASIYGQNPPLVNPTRRRGEWQTYDIVFYRPVFEGDKCVRPGVVTAFLNGVLVQDGWQLEGPTGHIRRTRQTKPPSAKGPVKLQQHLCPVRFRNVWVRELPERR